MSLSLADWRRLYKVLDPKRRLELEDMGLFVERHDAVAPAIARSLTSGFDEQGKWLICGSVGSGKSSELVKLAALLRDTNVVGTEWRAAGTYFERARLTNLPVNRMAARGLIGEKSRPRERSLVQRCGSAASTSRSSSRRSPRKAWSC